MVWINVVCKIFMAWYIFQLANRYLNTLFMRIIFAVVIFSGIHLLLISVFLWSEIIFMTLLLILTCATLRVHEKRFNYSILFIAGFLICLQRNAGIFWAAGTVVWLLTDKVNSTWKYYATVVAYALVSVSGLVAWHIYNILHVSGSAFHQRSFFSSIIENSRLITESLGKAFVPSAGAGASVAGVAIAVVLIYFWSKHFRSNRSISLLVSCVVIYTAGFLPIPALDFHDMERYFAVIFPVFLLFPLIIVQFLMERYPSRALLLRLCVIVWLIYPAWRMSQNALLWRRMNCHTAAANNFW